MYTFITFLIITLAAYVIAAAPSEESADCKPLKDKEEVLAKCCSILGEVSVKENAAAAECFGLIKDAGSKKGPAKPEGYECMDDCIMSKLGFLTADGKIDPAKVNAAVKSSFTGDWAPVGAKVVEKCLAKADANKDKDECSSSSNVYLRCLFREIYINCPEKSWTNSDLCKANKERLNKCPNSLPYLPENPKRK